MYYTLGRLTCIILLDVYIYFGVGWCIILWVVDVYYTLGRLTCIILWVG